jgi:hypothetical protein
MKMGRRISAAWVKFPPLWPASTAIVAPPSAPTPAAAGRELVGGLVRRVVGEGAVVDAAAVVVVDTLSDVVDAGARAAWRARGGEADEHAASASATSVAPAGRHRMRTWSR